MSSTTSLYKDATSFWEKRLYNGLLGASLPLDLVKGKECERSEFQFQFNDQVSSYISKLGGNNDLLMFTIFINYFKHLICKISDNADFIVTTPLLNKRNYRVNKYIVLTETINYNHSLKESLYSSKKIIEDSYFYEFVPVSELVDELGLYDIVSKFIVISENIHDAKLFSENNDVTQVDLLVVIDISDASINCKLTYNPNKFIRDNILTLFNRLEILITNSIDNFESKVDEISILTKEEKQKVLFEFNNKCGAFVLKTINELFKDQVLKTPESTAILIPNESFDKEGASSLTYQELDKKSTNLAKALLFYGIKADSIVSILAKKEVNQIISILGILKAGAIYLPINPNLPSFQIKHILKSSRTEGLLVDYELDKELDSFKRDNLLLNIDEIKHFENGSVLLKRKHLSDSCYIIYTSGTTGVPKGIVIKHQSIANYTIWRNKYYEFNENDITLQLLNYSFDGYNSNLYSSITTGGKLVIIPESSKLNARYISEVVVNHGITNTSVVPSYLKLLLEYIDEDIDTSLRFIVLAGDLTTSSLVDQCNKLLPQVTLYNEYGPTEATVAATAFKGIKAGNTRIIGTPISNTNIYILDSNHSPTPISTVGEIYISGVGLAKEYLFNRKLTNDKFLKIPSISDDYLYKTGDLARWLKSGNLEFIGRKDTQVKINGYRIELSEIESTILEYKNIKEVALVVCEDDEGEKFISAYFLSEGNSDLEELRQFIGNRLPSYMIPHHLLQIDTIPYTANGKVDSKKLMSLNKITGVEQNIPKGKIETKLVSVWSDILKVDKSRIGIDDNFFKIGGHSLKLIRLISSIQKYFYVNISFEEIYSNPTIRHLAGIIKNNTKSNYLITRVEKKEYYELSSAQKRLYFTQEYDREGVSYNMPAAYALNGDINEGKIIDAFDQLTEKHEILRTSFMVIGAKPVQIIQSKVDLDLEIVEIEEKEIDNYFNDSIKPFELNSAPLFRVRIIKTGNRRYFLFVDFHHIIFDGASVKVFMNDFHDIYISNARKPLNTIQYRDYSEWINKLKSSKAIQEQELFWLKEFKSDIPLIDLPYDFKRKPTIQSKGERVSFELSEEMNQLVSNFTQKHNTTNYLFYLSCHYILLSKISGQNDIIIGSLLSERKHIELEHLIGMFVKTIPIRLKIKNDKSFLQFLGEVKEKFVRILSNQDFQFEEIITKTVKKRILGRNPIFDILFAFENEENNRFVIPGVECKEYPLITNTSKFDLTFQGCALGNKTVFIVEYNTGLFSRDTINNFFNYYEVILNTVIHQSICLKDIEIIPEKEKKELLYEINNTTYCFPNNKTVVQMYEEQAGKVPDRIALSFNDMSLSYGELSKASEKIANYLVEKGVNKGTVIGIYQNRSINLLISIMGILKAGAVYLPISKEFPTDRIEYMLYDSSIALLLTDKKITKDIGEDYEIVDINNILNSYGKSIKVKRLNKSSDIVYIIYTSGSTGKPKGVLIEHGAVSNIINSLQAYYPLTQSDTYLFKTPTIFDVSISEIFGWILGAGKLAILEDGEEKNPYQIIEFVSKKLITHINFVPSMFQAFLDIFKNLVSNKLGSLKYIFLAGEAVTPELIKNYYNLHCRAQLENLYGPTENTIYGSLYSLQNWQETINVPIGKPFHNLRIYISNDDYKLQPFGIKGELLLGGSGVARGYLNNPELTSEKFKTNYYLGNERVYCTGDFVKLLKDGNIEFHGRKDKQVKIRGYRIEINEIENTIRQHQEVNNVAVLSTKCSTDIELHAYLEVNANFRLTQLIESLKETVPGYMIPSRFHKIKEIPQNSSGKFDYQALLGIHSQEITESVNIQNEKFLTSTEKMLEGIWKEVLNRTQIGLNEDFFSIGGDSIKSIQIAAKLNSIGYHVNLKDIFTNSTIFQLAGCVKKTNRAVNQGIVTGDIPLAPIQKWFLTLNQGEEKNHFNQSTILNISYRTSASAISNIFKTLAEHHDALRMVFYNDGFNSIMQKNRGRNFSIEAVYFDLSSVTNRKEKFISAINDLHQSINIYEGSLFKIGLFRFEENEFKLFIVFHHLIIDGVSWRILIEDFVKLFKSQIANKKIELPAKTDSFKSWSEYLTNYSQSDKILADIKYWNSESYKYDKILPDYDLYINVQGDTDTIGFDLSEQETKALKLEANFPFGTEVNELILTALCMALNKLFKIENVLVAIEGHGREPMDENINISRTIGWFTIFYPVLFNMGSKIDLSSKVKYVKETLRKRSEKGIVYSVYRYLMSQKMNIFNETPQISFNYLGEIEQINNCKFIDLSNESNGSQIGNKINRDFLIDVNCYIIDNKLKVNLTYNLKQFEYENIQHLIKLINNNLKDIITSCSRIKEKILTPSDLTYKELSEKELDIIQKKREVQDVYQLSPTQKSILFYTLCQSDLNPAYFEQIVFNLNGVLQVELLETAFIKLIDRHENLRSVFSERNYKEPIQIIVKNHTPDFRFVNIEKKSGAEKQSIVDETLKEEYRNKLDVLEKPPIRLLVIKTDDKVFKLVFTYHHIIIDGWALNILYRDLMLIYYRSLLNPDFQLPPKLSYYKYVEWINRQDMQKAKEYWTDYLSQFHEPNLLFGSKKEANFQDREKVLNIDNVVLEKITEGLGTYQLTQNVYFQTIWSILLAKLLNQQDIIFGSVISGRPSVLNHIENTVGVFINTVPVRVKIVSNKSFIEIARNIQKDFILHEQFGYLNLTEILYLTKHKEQLFNHIFVTENHPDFTKQFEKITLNENMHSNTMLELCDVKPKARSTYDLSIVLIPSNNFQVIFKYNSNVYTDQFIEILYENFQYILKQVREDINISVESIKIKHAYEKASYSLNESILSNWNF